MRRIDRSHSEVVLNLAEITDRKRVKNRQILVIHVVDLVRALAMLSAIFKRESTRQLPMPAASGDQVLQG